MKKILLTVVAALFILSVPQFLFALTPFDGSQPALKGDKPENFEDTKANILRRLDDRLRKTTEERACVEAARNHDDLKKCRPERPAPPGGQVPGAPGMMQKPQPPAGQPPQR